MATCEEMLAEVETAIQALAVGKKAVDVGYGERRVRYVQTDMATLQARRAELMAECGDCKKRRRPFTTSFDHR